jgi:hypothetical protein
MYHFCKYTLLWSIQPLPLLSLTHLPLRCWRGWGQTRTLIHCWWECKLIQLRWNAVWLCLKKLKLELPYIPVIALFGIYTKEYKSGYNRDICIPMFIEALFTIAKLWKQPRCPITDEWTKKLWYVYTLEFYSIIRNHVVW